MAELTGGVRRLLEEPNFGALATVMPDGSPQVTTVWVDTDGRHVLVNTAEGRQKPRNIRRDNRVALSIFDRQNPYAQATVRGKIVDILAEGADAHIDKLAKRYLGKDTYPFRRPGEQRLILKIEPERIVAQGVE